MFCIFQFLGDTPQWKDSEEVPNLFSVCDSQCFVPSKVEGLVQREGELIGRLHYKEGHDLYHWRVGWFVLEGSALHFSSGEEEEKEEMLQLKQLQELSKPIAFSFDYFS